MVNLDCGNNIYVDKNLLHVSTNSCEIVTGGSVPTTHNVLSYKNAKQNLSESCVVANTAAAASCNACNSLKIRSSCNINWTTVDIDKKVNCDDNNKLINVNNANSGSNNSSSNNNSSSSAQQQQQHNIDLNNTASNISISNLRTNSYKINDNNYSLYNNNQFGECNHIKQINKLNGKNHMVQKNTNFFKNFARSSSFLNGCKIRPNSKKLRNISLKLKKTEKVQQPQHSSHQSQQQLYQHQQQSQQPQQSQLQQHHSSSSSQQTLHSQLIQNNCSGASQSDSNSKNRNSLKLNDSIKNVYRNPVNSDLKNQYNAKSNECNNCHPSSQLVLNDFNKSYTNGLRAKNEKSIRNKVFDRQLSVPIENSAVNNLGIHATNKHCHSYSNSLNRAKKNGCKPNGR